MLALIMLWNPTWNFEFGDLTQGNAPLIRLYTPTQAFHIGYQSQSSLDVLTAWFRKWLVLVTIFARAVRSMHSVPFVRNYSETCACATDTGQARQGQAGAGQAGRWVSDGKERANAGRDEGLSRAWRQELLDATLYFVWLVTLAIFLQAL